MTTVFSTQFVRNPLGGLWLWGAGCQYPLIGFTDLGVNRILRRPRLPPHRDEDLEVLIGDRLGGDSLDGTGMLVNVSEELMGTRNHEGAQR